LEFGGRIASMTAYLDHNATTQPDEGVVDAMLPYLREEYGNPSGIHALARSARRGLDAAREQLAALVNAHPSQVVFTSGGTEANNLAMKSVVWGMGMRRIAVSAIEHASVMDVAAYLASHGAQVNEMAVTADGVVDMGAALDLITRFKPQLCSLMAANNETGAVQPVVAVGQAIREQNGILHVDAVQALGKIPVDFSTMGAHLMTVSAHKIYGPKGVGALIVDKALDLTPLLHGGGQEKGRRSGTENVAGIVGFGKAAELAQAEMSARSAHTAILRDALERRLQAFSAVTVFAQAATRLPNTVFFGVKGVDGETLIMNLDAAGMAVASGSACASKSDRASHVLLAMGVDEALARSAVRVSFGYRNTLAEVELFIGALERQLRLFSSMSALF